MSNVIPLIHSRTAPETASQPGRGECLPCFVRRMVEARGCSGTLVWAEHWKRERSPRASALIRRLEHRGATCDCSLVTLLWAPSPVLWDWDEGSGCLREPSAIPACAGVRPRATRPCAHWADRSAVSG